MNTLENNPVPRMRSRRTRRIASIVAYSGYMVWAGASLAGESWPLALQLSLKVLGIATTLVALYVLFYKSTLWKLANSPDEHLDERQVRVRDQAYRLAYSGVATVLVYALIYTAFAFEFGLYLPRNWDQANLLVWGGLLLTLTLPAVIIAWTEPEI